MTDIGCGDRMCAPVSVSMTPVLSLVSIVPAMLLAVISGLAGIAMVVKGLKPVGGE